MESDVKKMVAIWAVMAALLCGIITIFLFAGRSLKGKLADGSKVAVGGAMLAALNTASEYGFGGVIAALPGFVQVADALKAIPNPLLNQAITINILSGITGSSSGGMSIARGDGGSLCGVGPCCGIPLEVMHRVASMAAGGMDTLPHNGAIITLLAVTGLTHRRPINRFSASRCLKSSVPFSLSAFTTPPDWYKARAVGYLCRRPYLFSAYSLCAGGVMPLRSASIFISSQNARQVGGV